MYDLFLRLYMRYFCLGFGIFWFVCIQATHVLVLLTKPDEMVRPGIEAIMTSIGYVLMGKCWFISMSVCSLCVIILSYYLLLYY